MAFREKENTVLGFVSAFDYFSDTLFMERQCSKHTYLGIDP